MSNSLWLSCCITSACFLTLPAWGQVVPDGTTPTQIRGNCASSCDVTGGIEAGNNLFHSFDRFGISYGGSVYFVDPGVADIFTRVTGNSGSEIFGKLGVKGDANLWLLNPNGIIFGEGASLDLNGSFVATTANEIVFGSEGAFKANPDAEENLPLLTVQPSAFFTYQTGQNQPIEIRDTALQVEPQQSIVLLGANSNPEASGVAVDNAEIKASQGNIQLGAVSIGEIAIDSDFDLQVSDLAVKADINITNASTIDASGNGGGRINFNSNRFALKDNSEILSDSFGSEDSAEISIISSNSVLIDESLIRAISYGSGRGSDVRIETESLTISGEGAEQYQSLISGAFANTLFVGIELFGISTVSAASADAGQIEIASNAVNVTEGGLIVSSTFGSGYSGEIDLKAGNVHLDSSAIVSFAVNNSQGNIKDIDIEADNFSMENSSLISTATFGEGQGGDVSLKISEGLKLGRTTSETFLPTIIFTNSIATDTSSDVGAAGNIQIQARTIQLEEGGSISSGSGFVRPGATPADTIIFGGGGAGGNISINAEESIAIEGISANVIFPSSITSNTVTNSPAGNIDIQTQKLTIADGGRIAAESFSTGKNAGSSGNLAITASESIEAVGTNSNILLAIADGVNDLEMQDIQGFSPDLSTTTIDGVGGNITVNTPKFQLANGFVLSSGTIGEGNAGKISLFAETIDLNSGSVIGSSTIGSGKSGEIEINSDRLLIRNGSLLTTSSVGSGTIGKLTIKARESVELSNDPQLSQANFGLAQVQRGILTGNISGGNEAGELSIETKQLTVSNGMRIDITNGSLSNNGSSTALGFEALPDRSSSNQSRIVARESIVISGTLESDSTQGSSISTATFSSFPASDLVLSTSKLVVADGANISVNSFGEGAAGNLTIIGDRAELRGGTINGNTLFNKGGNIELSLGELLQLSDSGSITTNAVGKDNSNSGDGGNITINAPLVVAFPGSVVSADAMSGDGGKVAIAARNIFADSATEQFSARSELGRNGEVRLTAFNASLPSSVSQLPQKPLQKENTMVSRCGTGDNLGMGSFVYVGKGALSPTIFDGYGTSEKLLVDFGNSPTETYHIAAPSTESVLEATNWEVDGRELAMVVKKTPTIIPFAIAKCPFPAN